MNKIEITRKIIDDELILVQSEHTCFINMKKLHIIELEDLLEKFKKLRNFCRKQNIQLHGYNKTRSFVIENYNEYVASIKKYNFIFDELSEFWQHKELFAPLLDDKEFTEYNDILHNACKIFYKDIIYLKIERLNSDISSYIKHFESLSKSNSFAKCKRIFLNIRGA
jgi:hypothetical protein